MNKMVKGDLSDLALQAELSLKNKKKKKASQRSFECFPFLCTPLFTLFVLWCQSQALWVLPFTEQRGAP